MPFYLQEADIDSDIARFESVLIVPCRFCPAASTAVRSGEAYIEFPRRSLTTASYERLVDRMKRRLEERGIKTTVFKSRLPHQFVLCMWSSRRRKKLLEVARQHDAVVVMGCEGAVQTVRQAVSSADCKVIPGMQNNGLMSIKPRFSLPCNISLELESVSPVFLAEA